MSIDQSPETTSEAPVTDPEAPWGRRPDGTPYKRDPAAFAHLRGKPFGSSNGMGRAPTKRGAPAAPGKPVKRPSVASPLKHDAAGYAARFRKGIMAAAKVVARRRPVPGALIAVQSASLADSWGEVAVEYPKLGRLMDRLSKGTVLSDAIGGTMQLTLMIAYTEGMLRGTWLEDIVADAVHESMRKFMDAEEFADFRERAEKAEAERAAQAARAEAADAS